MNPCKLTVLSALCAVVLLLLYLHAYAVRKSDKEELDQTVSGVLKDISGLSTADEGLPILNSSDAAAKVVCVLGRELSMKRTYETGRVMQVPGWGLSKMKTVWWADKEVVLNVIVRASPPESGKLSLVSVGICLNPERAEENSQSSQRVCVPVDGFILGRTKPEAVEAKLGKPTETRKKAYPRGPLGVVVLYKYVIEPLTDKNIVSSWQIRFWFNEERVLAQLSLVEN